MPTVLSWHPSTSRAPPSPKHSQRCAGTYSGWWTLLHRPPPRRGVVQEQGPGRSHRVMKAQASIGGADLSTGIMTPAGAAIASALIALGSAGLNVWGGVLQEKANRDSQLKLELAKETLEQQRKIRLQRESIESVFKRYRGPLIQAAADLEGQLWYLGIRRKRWRAAAGDEPMGAGEETWMDDPEVVSILWSLASFLGLCEILRLELVREVSFLEPRDAGNALFDLIEGIRFILYAERTERLGSCWGNPDLLESRFNETAAGYLCEHPGRRSRIDPKDHWAIVDMIEEGKRVEAAAGEGGAGVGGPDLLKVTWPVQRAVGELMIKGSVSPFVCDVERVERGGAASGPSLVMGYSEFTSRLNNDEDFYKYHDQIGRDLLELKNGPEWEGENPIPVGRWTRVLLLQQLLVDSFDLLDPDAVRVPRERRLRLNPLTYMPLKNWDQGAV